MGRVLEQRQHPIDQRSGLAPTAILAKDSETSLTLTGDDNTPAMPMTEAQVNHLRHLLAWLRCEWMLDDDMQRGYLLGTAATVAHGLRTPEEAGAHIAERADKINRECPAYVRQAIKMLTKALRDHERAAGIVGAP